GVDTYVDVAEDQTITISTAGFWRPDPGTLVDGLGSPGTDGLDTLEPGSNYGQLIGRIDDGLGGGTVWFPIYDGVGITAAATGRLYLAINDFEGAYFDNSAAVFSNITVTGSTTGVLSGSIGYPGALIGNLYVRAKKVLCPECRETSKTV